MRCLAFLTRQIAFNLGENIQVLISLMFFLTKTPLKKILPISPPFGRGTALLHGRRSLRSRQIAEGELKNRGTNALPITSPGWEATGASSIHPQPLLYPAARGRPRAPRLPLAAASPPAAQQLMGCCSASAVCARRRRSGGTGGGAWGLRARR